MQRQRKTSIASALPGVSTTDKTPLDSRLNCAQSGTRVPCACVMRGQTKNGQSNPDLDGNTWTPFSNCDWKRIAQGIVSCDSPIAGDRVLLQYWRCRQNAHRRPLLCGIVRSTRECAVPGGAPNWIWNVVLPNYLFDNTLMR